MKRACFLLSIFTALVVFNAGMFAEKKLYLPPLADLTAEEHDAKPPEAGLDYNVKRPVYFEEISAKLKTSCSVVLSMPIKKGIRYFCEHERPVPAVKP